MKIAVNRYASLWKFKKIRYSALLKRARKSEKKLVLLQAIVRGHLTRISHSNLIQKIKRDAPKKTTKYKKICKI